MALGEKALRVDDELAIAATGDDRPDGLGRLFRQPATGGDQSDAHGQRLWLEQANLRNGRRDQRVCRFRVGCSRRAFVAGFTECRSLATDLAVASFALLA